MKKIISLVMAMLIILSMGVFADDVMLISEEGAVVEETAMPNYLTAYGEIKEAGEDYIVVNTADGEVQFNYSDEFTFLIDAGTVEYFNIAERSVCRCAGNCCAVGKRQVIVGYLNTEILNSYTGGFYF